MDPKLQRAVSYAAQQHREQLRKDGKTPYIAHPMRVMATLQLYEERDVDMLCAAVLHDTIEDTRTDYDDLEERFGRRTAYLVATLTKDKRLPHDVREAAYETQVLEGGSEVRWIKMADMLDNFTDECWRGKGHEQSLLRHFGFAQRLARMAKSSANQELLSVELLQARDRALLACGVTTERIDALTAEAMAPKRPVIHAGGLHD